MIWFVKLAGGRMVLQCCCILGGSPPHSVRTLPTPAVLTIRLSARSWEAFALRLIIGSWGIAPC